MGYIRLKNGQVALRPKTNLKWQEMQIISYDIALSWTGVVYGGDKFVALPDLGHTSAQSTDGITWTQTTWQGKELQGKTLTYGGNKYVAAGAYSTDGITWTETTMPALGGDEQTFYSRTTYGGNKFVAVGRSYNGAYSTDGITWVQMNMPSFREWDNIAYGNDMYVATSSNEYSAYYPDVEDRNFIARSTDGITWVAVTPLFANTIQTMIYANGQFVALSSTEVGRSSDGETWNISQHRLSFIPWVLAYGGGRFIALGDVNSNSWAYSTDGINWTEATATVKKSWRSMAYGSGRFVAVAGSSNNGAYLNASDFNK